jgi:hypothetical protein
MRFLQDIISSLAQSFDKSTSGKKTITSKKKKKKEITATSKERAQTAKNQSDTTSAMPTTPEPTMPELEVPEDFLKRVAKNRRQVTAFESEINKRSSENK